MIRTILLLLLTLPLAAQDSIQFRMSNGLILLDATVNGKQAYFIVDCGSATSYLNESLSRKFNFQSENVSGSIAGFGGNANIYHVTSAVNISFGDLEAIGSVRKSCDLTPFSKLFKMDIAGLLGNDFLSFYNAKIDFEKRVIVF